MPNKNTQQSANFMSVVAFCLILQMAPITWWILIYAGAFDLLNIMVVAAGSKLYALCGYRLSFRVRQNKRLKNDSKYLFAPAVFSLLVVIAGVVSLIGPLIIFIPIIGWLLVICSHFTVVYLFGPLTFLWVLSAIVGSVTLIKSNSP